MRYIIAVIGSTFIFIAVFLIFIVFNLYLPDFLRKYYVVIWPIATNNILGLVLAPLAAAASYRGTLRHYKNKDLQRGSGLAQAQSREIKGGN
jgi:uncharacterized membrane protein